MEAFRASLPKSGDTAGDGLRVTCSADMLVGTVTLTFQLSKMYARAEVVCRCGFGREEAIRTATPMHKKRAFSAMDCLPYSQIETAGKTRPCLERRLAYTGKTLAFNKSLLRRRSMTNPSQ
ncbi:hypothetical protein [Geoalkalibacter sp.]|jgi:hypothetical protein|uniref:hypothetical protein n=1 Tax=Geoalkalibacter sp. TaxID=3041440 RepID=UPI003D124A25